MIRELYEALWIFFLYSFFGWCLEVVYFAVTEGKFVNRGFLTGPSCPVYGFGVLFVLRLLVPVYGNLPLLFLGSVLITTAVEFIIGWLTEKIIHERLWDYSECPFNVKGYICLKNSLLWGLGCLFVVRVLQPALMKPLALLPERLGWVLIALCGVVFLTDLVLTGAEALKLPKQIKAAEEAERLLLAFSDTIGGGLAGTVLRTQDKRQVLETKLEDYKEKLGNYKERIAALADYRELAQKLEGYKEFIAKRADLKELEGKLEGYRALLSRSNRTGRRWSRAYPRFNRSALSARLEKLKEFYENVKK